MDPQDTRSGTAHSGYQDDVREARPFYVILLLVLAAAYGVAVQATPDLHQPLRLIPFTVLLLIHGALHWWSLRLPLHPRWIYPYFTGQTLIVFVMGSMSAGHGVILGLYLALAGEAVGVLQDLRKSTPVVAAILGTAVLNYGLVLGWTSLPGWLAFILPMAFFVIVYVAMFGRQMRGRQEAQRLLRELETAHRQLAEYAARVEELTLAGERRRLARELHDTLAQGLAGLILQLEAVDSHLSSGRAAQAQAIVQQAMARARSTLSEARAAIGELREGGPTRGSLAQAIRDEVERFTDATGIECQAEILLPPAVEQATGDHVLRAIAEGLSNVARHARATHVQLTVANEGHDLSVHLADDGTGFDPASVQASAGHYGLVGLRERARHAGGSLTVESAPGHGTGLHLRLPLHVPEEMA